MLTPKKPLTTVKKGSISRKTSSDLNEKPGNTFIEPNIQPGFLSGLFGNVDTLKPDSVSGWVIDVERPTESLNVTIYFNGIAIAHGITDTYRPDISKITQVSANCGFHIKWDKKKISMAIVNLKKNQLCPITICPDDGTRSLGIPITPSVATIQDWLKTDPVDGHLDQVDSNLSVTGWAVDPSKDCSARVEIFLDGVIVIEKDANLPRPDFILSKPDYVMSGFKIQIPRKALTRLVSKVEARVNGFLLPGSPIKLDITKKISISIPKIENGKLLIQLELNGWPGEAIEGELQIDGRMVEVLKLKAVHDKTDTTKKFEGHWTLPKHLIDGQPHVYVFSVPFGNSVVRSDASILSYPQYSIHIDKADMNVISGWTYRHDRSSSLQLNLTRNGVLENFSSANITRIDVWESSDLAPKNTGFNFILNSTPNTLAVEFELVDVETDIAVVSIAICSPYENLVALANDLVSSHSLYATIASRAVLSQIIMKADGELACSIKKCPSPKRSHHASEEVDIIIPVYGGAIETVECIESVLAAKNKTLGRIIVVNDCTPDKLIEEYFTVLEKRDRDDLVVIHRTTNGGFSEAVNIGMIVAGDRDVILLNADTVVQSGWIDRLAAAASGDSRIGTVTPLSNNAEICTIPYLCKSLPVSEPALAVEVDHAAATVNAGKVIDIPVAIGFCMYIRRQCIDEIGLFDAATWGRGYGEEVDFCLKASAHGWRHVMTGDTFVVHRGNVSFGDEKFERIKESAKKISELYPFYEQVIQRFLAADPGAEVRRKLNIELIGNALPQKRILHVTHGFGGGTEQYLKDMLTLNIEAGYTPLVLRFMDTGTAELDVELADTRLAGFFADEHQEKYAAHEIEAIKTNIVKLGFERLHIHAPFGVSFGLLEWLSTTFPFNITIHDYAWICPRASLTTSGGRYCGEPQVEQCNSCVQFYKPHSGLKHLVKEVDGNIANYRERFSKIIARAETVFVGADDVEQRMKRHGMLGNYKAIPHPAPKDSVFAISRNLANQSFNGGQIKIALFGGISDIKGFHVLLECAEYAFKNKLPLQFIVFGYTMDDALCLTLPNIELLGKYKEEELEDLVQQHQPHLSFFPNQWPETFSYTLSHSIRLGIWPVVSDIGAPAERVRENQFGATYIRSIEAIDICTLLIDQAICRAKKQNNRMY